MCSAARTRPPGCDRGLESHGRASPDGLELETHFKKLPAGAATRKRWRSSPLPAPGEEMFKFSSPYARSFATQLATILARSHLGQMRDVGYNCGRIGVLFILYILFGIIYFDLNYLRRGRRPERRSSSAMMAIFTGIICMSSVARSRAAAVSFRGAAAPATSSSRTRALIGSRPCTSSSAWSPPPAVFSHVLINVLVSYAFLSVGQTIACTVLHIQTAQAGTGAFIPIAFLFGGCTLRARTIPVYWKWAHFIRPVAFAIQNSVAWRLDGSGAAFRVLGVEGDPNRPSCPSIVAFHARTSRKSTRCSYVEDKYDVTTPGGGCRPPRAPTLLRRRAGAARRRRQVRQHRCR